MHQDIEQRIDTANGWTGLFHNSGTIQFETTFWRIESKVIRIAQRIHLDLHN